MPSKHSERLKQAIDYIRSGEKEIAREIILEIIQADPDYEKAWIWLVETVPDRANKIDILKTRLEQYPETSPFSRIALDKIAPEVLDTLVPASEAIIYPPGMEPRSEATEDEIQYNVSIDQDDHEQFRLEEDDLIQFEEPEDSSPFETSDSNVFHELQQKAEEDDLFAELPKEAPAEEDITFDLFEDVEAEVLQEKDLDAFLDNEKDQPTSGDFEGDDFDSWLAEEAKRPHAESVDELANLLNDVAPLDENGNIVAEDDIDDYGVFGITEDTEDFPSNPKSSPFILDEDSKQILGSAVVEQAAIESRSLDDLFRDASTGDLTPSTGFLDAPDFPLMDQEGADALPISQADINAASDNFRDNLMAESISHSDMHQRRMSQQLEKQQQKVEKKKKEKNATFVFGCSIMAAVLFFSLIAMGYVLLQNAKHPTYRAVTITPTPTATITPTATSPAVAPWLDETEGVTELTLTPEEEETGEEPDVLVTPGDLETGTGLGGLSLQGWVTEFESYGYECNLLESSGDTYYQTCEYLDADFDVLVFLYGTEETMPTRIEYQVMAMETENLISSDILDALIADAVAPLVLLPVTAEFNEEASTWFLQQCSNLVAGGRENEVSQTYDELTITVEYTYFLRIEL